MAPGLGGTSGRGKPRRTTRGGTTWPPTRRPPARPGKGDASAASATGEHSKQQAARSAGRAEGARYARAMLRALPAGAARDLALIAQAPADLAFRAHFLAGLAESILTLARQAQALTEGSRGDPAGVPPCMRAVRRADAVFAHGGRVRHVRLQPVVTRGTPQRTAATRRTPASLNSSTSLRPAPPPRTACSTTRSTTWPAPKPAA